MAQEHGDPPRVILRALGDTYTVLIDPPLADGDHCASFREKHDAWGEARALWSRHRLGFFNEADATTGHANHRREPTE